MATTAAEEDNTPAAPKKRKTKDLPDCLSFLNENNFKTFLNARLETDQNEMDGVVMVAYAFSLQGEGEGTTTLDLSTLNLDQMRKLCRKVGVKYANKCTKFNCRKAMSILAEYQEQRESDSLPFAGTLSDRMTTNIVRLTNIIFSHEFLDSFLTLNDIKKRADHEANNLPKNFWDDVMEAMNNSEDDDPTPTKIVLSLDDLHIEEFDALDLRVYDIMTAAAIKKRF